MRRAWIALLVLLALPAIVLAQPPTAPVQIYAATSGNVLVPVQVNASGQLVISGGGGGGDVNITEILGAAPSATNPLPVRITNGSAYQSLSSDATSGDAAISTGPQVMVRADTTTPTAVDDGDAVALFASTLGELYQRNQSPCSTGAWSSVNLNISSATTTEIIDQSVSNKAYICGYRFVVSAADNIAFVEDADNACASPSGGLAGGTTSGTGFNLVANQGMIDNGGGYPVMASSATNLNVCIITSSTAQLSGRLWYVLAP